MTLPQPWKMTGRPWLWAELDDAGDGRLVVAAPVVGPHEEALAIRHVAPDDHAVEKPVGGLDLRLRHLELELADAQELLAEALGVLADPQSAC